MTNINKAIKEISWILIATATLILTMHIIPVSDKLRFAELECVLIMLAMSVSGYFLVSTNYMLSQNYIYSLLSMAYVYADVFLMLYISFRGKGYMGNKNDIWCVVGLLGISCIIIIMIGLAAFKVFEIEQIKKITRVSIAILAVALLAAPRFEHYKNAIIIIVIGYLCVHYILYFSHIRENAKEKILFDVEIKYDWHLLLLNTVEFVILVAYIITNHAYLRALSVYVFMLKEYCLLQVIYKLRLKMPWDELLKKSKDTTLRIQNNEVNRRMIINLSHELKTPINVILSALELMSLDMKKDAELMNYIYKINVHCNECMKIIKSLIETNKLKMNYVSPHYDYYNLVEIIENTISAICQVYDLDNIIFNTEEEEICVRIDKNLMQSSLISLFYGVSWLHHKEKIEVEVTCKEDLAFIQIKNEVLYQAYKDAKEKNKEDIGQYLAAVLNQELIALNNAKYEFWMQKGIKIILDRKPLQKMNWIDEAKNVEELSEMIRSNYNRKMYFGHEVC